VPVGKLSDLKEKQDYIFSSHTLEHISNLEEVLLEMTKVLKDNGKIIFHVPAYTCVRWRYGIHVNKAFNDHHWSFHLKSDQVSLDHALAIDETVAKFFTIEKAAYTGDNSIIIFGKQKGAE
jgi:predicted SAM-dependent methyltransferase